jgi:hypothetical protein
LPWKQASRPQFHFDCLDIGEGYSRMAYFGQFWKIALDLKNFDLQCLERSLNQDQ